MPRVLRSAFACPQETILPEPNWTGGKVHTELQPALAFDMGEEKYPTSASSSLPIQPHRGWRGVGRKGGNTYEGHGLETQAH